jgi:hypothetical protein
VPFRDELFGARLLDDPALTLANDVRAGRFIASASS